MKKLCTLTAFAALSLQPLQADENRQHDAHEHGAAKLGIAQEGNVILIELDSPAYNIVGFEHDPGNDEERAKLAKDMLQLEEGTDLFRFSAAAQCSLDSVELSSGLLEDDHTDDHADDHDHDHEHEDDAGHADIEAFWTFNCEYPERVQKVELPLFSFFNNLTDLDVDYILDVGQGSVELSPLNTVISF